MKFLITFLILLFSFSYLFSQEKKIIQILGANELRMANYNNLEAKMLKGNVSLQQDDVILRCDSALFYNDVNAVDAFGHVHITQKETNIYSDSLKYNGDTKIAILFGNVLLDNPQMKLTTDRLTYYMDIKKGIYTTGGTVVNGDKTLNSEIGYYFPDDNMAYFRKNVTLNSSKFNIIADTLSFNTSTEVTFFNGPTKIIDKENTIICKDGFFDSKKDYSEFGKNTVMYSKEQILKTDSLQYNSLTKAGRTFKYFNYADTTSGTILEGTIADFTDNGNYFKAIDKAMLVYIIDKDSLFISGDTLKSITDTVTDITTFFCFHKVKFYKSNMQGKCDSLYFSYSDSIIRMFVDPIIWNEANQMSGDTIFIYMKNEKIDRFRMYENGFMTSLFRKNYFNQIKGSVITGYFKNDKLDWMNVDSNAESIYFAEDAKKALIGANKAIGSAINIYLKDEEVDRIVFLQNPEATFYPIQKTNSEELFLKGFNWKPQFRPLSKKDVLKQ